MVSYNSSFYKYQNKMTPKSDLNTLNMLGKDNRIRQND